jgi:hypothetical protein
MKQDLHLHKILHRLLGAWIAVVMLAFLPQAALAQGSFSVNSFQYKITNAKTHEVSLTFLNNSTGLPEELTLATVVNPTDGITYAVTGIENTYEGNYYLSHFRKMVFPNVTTVGPNAFNNCDLLEEIILPKATSIGKEAFHGCTNLIEITAPNVTTIGEDAFRDCSNLKDAIFPKVTTLEDRTFSQCENLITATLPLLKNIGHGNFNACATLTNASFPLAETIGGYVFYNCYEMKMIALPKLDSIGERSFYNDRNPKTTPALYLGATAPTKINALAFEGTVSPRYLYPITENGISASSHNYGTEWNGWSIQNSLPDSSAIIKISGVPDTIRLRSSSATITLDDTVTFVPTKYKKSQIIWEVAAQSNTGATISNNALTVTNTGIPLIRATVKYNGETIYTQGFPINVIGYEKADTFTVDSIIYRVSSTTYGDSTVSVIGYTFTTPKSLAISTVTTPTGNLFTVDSIGDGALKDAPLKSVSFPNVKNIGANAFENDTLSSASFPILETIGDEAFKNNAKLLSLSLGATAPTVGTDAFNGCPSGGTLTLVDKNGKELSDAGYSSATANQYGKSAGFANGLWYGWALPKSIFIGSARLFVPAMGTAYYTYSEASGSSVLTPSDANTYNVSASFTDKTLNITLQNITVNDSHESVYDPNKQITVHPALFIAYTEGNTHLNTQEATVLQSSYDYQAAGGIYYFSYDSTTQESDTLILNNSGSLISGYTAIKGGKSTQGLYHTNFDCSFGITTIGNLVIDNSGEMTMKPNKDNMYGIDVHGSLLIKGTGPLYAYATSSVSSSIVNSSYGIRSEKKITVSLQSSGSLYASGIHQYEFSQNGYSYGIYAPEIKITSGSFLVRGSTQAMNVRPTFTGSAIASEDYYGNDAVVYNANNISTYHFIRNGFSSFIGNAPLNISSTGTTYYTYSEAGGNSSLTPSNAENYNVSASLSSDLVLNLTFKGLKVNVNYDDSSYGYAVYLDGAMTKVKLNLIGDNTFTGLASQKGIDTFYSNAATEIINDSGTLTIQSKESGDYNYAIYGVKTLSIDNNGTINIIGGKAGSESYGIETAYDIHITGKGKTNIQSGECRYWSVGIYTYYGNITIEAQGSVKVAASTANNSYGLESFNSINMNSGDITIQGKSSALYAAPDLTAFVNPYATASTNYDGSSPVTYDATAYESYQYFNIKEKILNLADATITLSENSFEADGTQKKPSVTSVVLDGKTLTEGTDYTVTYGDNVNPGKGTVTIIGKGDYTGSQTVTFTIYAKPVYVIIPKVDGVSVTPGFGLNLAGIGQPF